MKFFLSPQQKYLLELLKTTDCMKKTQILTLLRRQFGTSAEAIGPICRQLRNAGYIREFDGIISAVGAYYEPFIPQAIDLLLAVFPHEFPIFERCSKSSLYALGAKSGLLARVFHVSREQKALTIPEHDSFLSNTSTLTILLLDDAAQVKYIPPQLPCLLAYPDHNAKLVLKQHYGGKIHENQ